MAYIVMAIECVPLMSHHPPKHTHHHHDRHTDGLPLAAEIWFLAFRLPNIDSSIQVSSNSNGIASVHCMAITMLDGPT